jgi:biopolymer transport protein ExbD
MQSSRHLPCERPGITRIELLVVFVVIIVLVSLRINAWLRAERSPPDELEVHLDQDGDLVLVRDSEVSKLGSDCRISLFMYDQYHFFKRNWSNEEAQRIVVVIRCDNGVDIKHIDRVVRAAKKAGLKTVLVRTNSQSA